ncbi:GNAT family N-acetyltransferase [Lentilactobacillus buchneri]|uniref:GNAT family N-acetyltransferase n=1 Tax=Lentilactobacillus buchneri TaxID=1581 RepID=UPI0012928834|nr:GNAT family N-acetyltransferase [Lentilactobacillus buchneri]MQN23317.1 GNAT family N-acetyltransferase [Lentilactobacillus buchneri]
MAITYSMTKTMRVSDYQDIVTRAKLHRQLNDETKIYNMLQHADYLFTAWDGDKLVGFSRGMTDYGDMVYVGDLGVDENYRKLGIGHHLLDMVSEKFGSGMHVGLFASEMAKDYYEKVGFTKDPRGYMKNPDPLDPHD